MKYRIALISDIHGNDVALKEVLKRVKDVDEIICLGDMIGIGPNGNEVLDIIRKIKNISCIMGNHDRYYLYGFNNPVSCTTKIHQDWQHAQISEVNGEFLKTIPLMIKRRYNNKDILFIHYGIRDLENKRFMPIAKNPTYEDLEEVFINNSDADIYFFGHEHIRSIVKGKKEYVCIGSLGCPVPSTNEGRYAILEIDDDSITYELKSFTYDPSPVIKDMIEKNMPENEFIRKNFYMQE